MKSNFFDTLKRIFTPSKAVQQLQKDVETYVTNIDYSQISFNTNELIVGKGVL